MNDNFDRNMIIGFVILVAVIIWLFIMGDRSDKRKHDATCAHLMTLARTPRDTLDVSMRCELKSEDHTTMIPVVIPVRTR